MAINKQQNPTLCWQCKNATGGCSWSKDFTPVAGWNAIPTKLKAVTQNIILHSSYLVIDCPQFTKG